ncbi:MAG: DUF1993 family protein [Steroidobacteraceae bacterium]
MRRGSFSPERSPPPGSFAALECLGAETDAVLEPAELERLAEREMQFVSPERDLAFNGENLLLSFAQAKFYFHATTGYDILCAQGVAIGKRDSMVRLRLKA